MSHRILAALTACFGLLVPSLAAAVTVVVDTNISLAPDWSINDYILTVYQDAAATDYTSVVLDFDGTSVNFVAGNVDEGSDWYLVEDGDAFSKWNVAGGLFPELYVDLTSSGPIPVGPGNFFVGVNTGVGFDEPDPNRDEFGWAELSISGTELVLVGNAVAYGAKGIFVGTAIPIPEPSTAVSMGLGLVGVAVVGRRRRAR